MKKFKGRLALLLVVCVMMSLLSSCADRIDGGNSAADSSAESDTTIQPKGNEAVADGCGMESCEHEDCDSVPFTNVSITSCEGKQAYGTGSRPSYDFGGSTYRYDISLNVFTSTDEMHMLDSTGTLDYGEDFFTDNSLLCIQVEGTSETAIGGLTHLYINEIDEIVAVIRIDNLAVRTSKSDEIIWTITAELSNKDIRKCIVDFDDGTTMCYTRETFVEWNIPADAVTTPPEEIEYVSVPFEWSSDPLYYKGFAALETGGPCDCDGDLATHTYDYPLWTPDKTYSYHRLNAPETYTVTVNGKTYTGTYEDSELYSKTTFIVDNYDTDSGTFSVRIDTGDIVEFFSYCSEDSEETVKYSYDECLEIAKSNALAAASNTGIDLSEYELTTEDYKSETYFRFERYVEGVLTNDRITVCVSAATGNVSFISAGDFGSFVNMSDEEKDMCASLLSPDALAALEAKIEALYPGYESYNVSYERYVSLTDGYIGILRSIEVKTEGHDSYLIEIMVCPEGAVEAAQ
ncbi:MAG: hypothetical protein LUH54_05780 [Firmicutes bacterium]|nr:hypothetical protein [Bacillota bacterium]